MVAYSVLVQQNLNVFEQTSVVYEKLNTSLSELACHLYFLKPPTKSYIRVYLLYTKVNDTTL